MLRVVLLVFARVTTRSCLLCCGGVLDEGGRARLHSTAPLVVEETTDVTLAERVKQGTSRRLLANHRNSQSELVYKLVLANLADIKAELSNAFVDILMTRRSTIISHSYLIQLF